MPPLDWTSIRIPFWAYLIPYGKWDWAKRRFDEVLSSRSPHDIARAWSQTGLDLPRIKWLSQHIAGLCEWPNANFIPDDRCYIVFWDHGPDMQGVAAVLDLENRSEGKLDVPAYVTANYGEFARDYLATQDALRSLRIDEPLR